MPVTIDTPRACPGGCGARVAIELVPVEPTLYPREGESASDLAEKRRVLNADGELHTCPERKPDERRARRLARAKRRHLRDDAVARQTAAGVRILEPASKLWVPGDPR